MAKSAAKPVPDGYHTITPNLVCRDAARAIEFYKTAFGAEERDRASMPDGKIMHAALRIGDSMLFLGDEMPHMGCHSPEKYGGTPAAFYLYVNDVDAAWKRATDAGAKVQMPLADMFWGDRCGRLVDPFGHVWSLSQHKEDVSPEEMKTRQQAFLSQMGKTCPA
jgi:uncharacterized glyoxalase superfamily protein PhnB